MSERYQSGQIMTDKKLKTIKCCRHKNLVPLEIGIASKTWPNGYTVEPYYDFAVSLIGANVIRIKSYICTDCKMEIKAPDPGQLKRDRL